ncbi:MAG: DUF6044 family protein [Magnetococcus sp. XQGC-1]
MNNLSRFFWRVGGFLPAPTVWTGNQWLLFWFIWSLLISSVYWILGPYSYVRIQDTADFNLPYRIAAARDLLTYGVTWWQPLFSGGMPSWALPLADGFLINGPPFLLLPPWMAYGVVMWLQRFLAAYFGFRLCRDSLKLHPVAALFGGLAFSLNTWSVEDWTLYDGLGPAGTPFFLWLFARCLRASPVRGWLGAFFLGLFVSLVTSAALYTVFLWGALPFWFVVVQREPLRRSWGHFGLFILGSALAAAPSVVALLIYLPQTARTQPLQTPPPGLWTLWSAAWETIQTRYVLPNLGFLVLLGLGLSLRKHRDSLPWRLLALFLFASVGAEALYIGQMMFPGIWPSSKGNLKDFSQFTLLLGVLCGAAGLSLVLAQLTRWSENVNRKLLGLVTLGVLVLSILAWKHSAYLLSLRLPTDNYSVNFDNQSIKSLEAFKREGPFRLATIGARLPTVKSASGNQIYPGYVFAYGFESADGYYRMHSARLRRFWLRVIAGVLDKDPKLVDRVMKWQYLFAPLDGAFDRMAAVPVADWYNLNMLSLFNTRFLLSHWPLQHPSLRLIHRPSVEGAKRQAWGPLNRRHNVLRVLREGPPPHAIYLYENMDVLPRAYFVGDIQVFADPEILLDQVARAPLERLRKVAFMEQGDVVGLVGTQSGLAQGTVAISRPRPDKVVLAAKTEGPAMLVLTDIFDPFWRLWINGQEKKLYPVYHLFRGIFLEQSGDHEVILEYWPPYRPGRGALPG